MKRFLLLLSVALSVAVRAADATTRWSVRGIPWC